MRKSMIILDLSELPEGETVDSFLKTMKEKGVMIVDTNGKGCANTKIMNYEVDDESAIQEKVNERIKNFILKFTDLATANPLVYEQIKSIVNKLGHRIII